MIILSLGCKTICFVIRTLCIASDSTNCCCNSGMATKPMPRVRAGVSGSPVITISGTKRTHAGSTRSTSLSGGILSKDASPSHTVDHNNITKDCPRMTESGHTINVKNPDCVSLSSLKKGAFDIFQDSKLLDSSSQPLPLGQGSVVAPSHFNTSDAENGNPDVQQNTSLENEISDVNKLKDLMMLQVSLISRQQDLLKLRDKEIMQLKASNHSLKSRLERMERRISLVRKNHVDVNSLNQQFVESIPAISEKQVLEEDTKTSEGAAKVEADVSATYQPSSAAVTGVNTSCAESTTTLSVVGEDAKLRCSAPAKTERPLEIESQYPMIDETSSTCVTSTKSPDSNSKLQECVPVPISFIERRRNQFLCSLFSSPLVTVRGTKQQSPCSDFDLSNLAFKICDRCPHCIAMATEIARLLSIASNEESKEDNMTTSHPLLKDSNYRMLRVSSILPKQTAVEGDDVDGDALLTSHPYYRQFWTSDPGDMAGSAADGSLDGAVLHIPTWREHEITGASVAHNLTENVDDESYLKRHTKFETAEKRRKRWDIQRIREFRYNEKLRQKLLKQERREGVLESFTPSVWEMDSVEVQNHLPVNVFGHSLPYIAPREFTLDDQQSSPSQT